MIDIPIRDHGGQLTEVVLFTTTRCDLQCLHCNEVNNRTPQDLPIEHLPPLLERLARRGVERVALSGGEPHLHPRFDELIEQIVAAGLGFTVVSNGHHYERYIRLLRLYPEAFHSLTFSLDGASAETHDRIRGRGSFALVSEALRCFTLLGRPPSANICLHLGNYEQLEAIGEFAVERGASSLGWLTVERSWSRELCLSEAQRLAVFSRLMALKHRLAVPFILHPSLFRAYRAAPVHFCEMFDFSHPTIDYDGTLLFCCNVDKRMPGLGSALDGEDAWTKGARTAAQLRATRAKQLEAHELDEDFNTCDFCSRNLAALLDGAPRSLPVDETRQERRLVRVHDLLRKPRQPSSIPAKDKPGFDGGLSQEHSPEIPTLQD